MKQEHNLDEIYFSSPRFYSDEQMEIMIIESTKELI